MRNPVFENSVAQLRSSRSTGSIRRLIFGLIGTGFVVLGAVGVFLPGIPTVGPLLAAAYFFAKSFPALEMRLIRNRFFQPYLRFIDNPAEMTWRTRSISIMLMWLSIFISCAFICSIGAPFFIPALIVASGVGGTWFIVNFGRRRK